MGGAGADAVYGMRVEAEHSPARTIYGEKTFWFCSDICRDRFTENPRRYIEMRQDALRAEGQID